jgi:ELWxxDGT repeat protein
MAVAIVATALIVTPAAAMSAPYLVKNIKAGAGDSTPFDLTALNGIVIFSASGGGKGRELWRTDGTAAGTVRVLDIHVGKRSSDIRGITRVGDLAYFIANDGPHGSELWVTDGTALGTHMTKDIVPGKGSGNPQLTFYPDGPVAIDVGGIAYFTTWSDQHLWRSDGTDAGTYWIPGSPNDVSQLTSFGGKAYFAGDGHLWRSDGTTAGTKVLKNSKGALVKAPDGMAATDSHLFYQYTGTRFWRSDGTANGTFKVLDLGPGCTYNCTPTAMTSFGNLLYFQAGSLWRSDGSAAGTWVVGPGSDSYPTQWTGAGANFYFHASDSNLWATDGTPNSGHTVDNGSSDFCCYEMTDVGGDLYFTGYVESVNTYKLFRYDASTNTTTEVGPAGAEWPLDMTVLGNRLLFSARDARGRELWAVDL